MVPATSGAGCVGVAVGESSRDEGLVGIRRLFGGDGGVMMSQHQAHREMDCHCLSGHDELVRASYAEHFGAIDPLAKRVRSGGLRLGEVVREEELMPRSELQKTAFFNGFCRPLEIAHAAHGMVGDVDGWVVSLVIRRTARGGVFEPEELRTLEVYLRHLTRAFGLARVRGLGRSLLDLDALARRHGLTPAEARVAELLFEKGSLRAVADSLNRSLNTVRSQLKSVYAKTGARSQVQLIRRLQSPSSAATRTGER